MAWWWLAACSGGPEVVETQEDGLRHLSVGLESTRTGVARLEFDVGADETALLATAQVGPSMTNHVLALYGPEGEPVWRAEDWLGGTESKSNAMFLSTTVSLNWPIDTSDDGLSEGTWTLDVGVVDGDLNYTEGTTALDIVLKSDDDFDAGEIDVAIVYTAGLADDVELRGAMAEALLQWEELLAPAGLTLSVEPIVWSGPTPSDTPATDSDAVFADIAAMVGLRTVPVVIVENIEGIDALGLAGDIPGPLVATNRSAVIVSHWQTAGIDLLYNNVETRILAETLAHETGHFLGLFHPVEINWDLWDALPDTPQCTSADDCEDALGDNLMFPYPVCFPPPCKAQSSLSDVQHTVLHRYTGTN